MVFPFKEKGFFVFFCVWLLFWIANIVDNIIWDTTSGIKAKVRVEVMVGEKGKGSGIEKFDGTYFAYWRMQIEDYLYEKKLHLPLLGTKLETMKNEDWNLLDRQVVGVIWLTLSRSVAHNIVKEYIYKCEVIIVISILNGICWCNHVIHHLYSIYY